MYRFDLNGHQVSCDTVEELVAATSFAPAEPQQPQKPPRAGAPAKTPHKGGSANARAWAIAKAYAKWKQISSSAARSYLAEHPAMYRKIEADLVNRGEIEPVA